MPQRRDGSLFKFAHYHKIIEPASEQSALPCRQSVHLDVNVESSNYIIRTPKHHSKNKRKQNF